MPQTSPRVGLFVTCLVDLFRPSVGFAAVKLLEDAGCRVEVPEAQTCCGQPAFNSGDTADAAAIARNVIAAFRGYDYVVAPSGSCGGMIVKHYPELFAPGTADHEAALELAGRTHELVSFLTRVMKVEKVERKLPGTGHLP
jgi:L-lactate dehydrogenase complex protein LldE